MPLHEKLRERLQEMEWFRTSPWSHVVLASKAKYLGVVIGPEATPDDSYREPMSKMHKRVQQWRTTSLSLFYKFRVWNTYIIPLLSYIDQCFQQPQWVSQDALRHLRTLVGGVNGWVAPNALGMFGEWFGFPSAPRLPVIAHRAALLRHYVALKRNDASLFPKLQIENDRRDVGLMLTYSGSLGAHLMWN